MRWIWGETLCGRPTRRGGSDLVDPFHGREVLCIRRTGKRDERERTGGRSRLVSGSTEVSARSRWKRRLSPTAMVSLDSAIVFPFDVTLTIFESCSGWEDDGDGVPIGGDTPLAGETVSCVMDGLQREGSCALTRVVGCCECGSMR